MTILELIGSVTTVYVVSYCAGYAHGYFKRMIITGAQ